MDWCTRKSRQLWAITYYVRLCGGALSRENRGEPPKTNVELPCDGSCCCSALARYRQLAAAVSRARPLPLTLRHEVHSCRWAPGKRRSASCVERLEYQREQGPSRCPQSRSPRSSFVRARRPGSASHPTSRSAPIRAWRERPLRARMKRQRSALVAKMHGSTVSGWVEGCRRLRSGFARQEDRACRNIRGEAIARVVLNTRRVLREQRDS